MPELWRLALTFLAGVVTGTLSGAFGIGGGVVSNPALRLLGLSPIAAVGSTLPCIIPGSVAGAARYRNAGLLHQRVVLLAGGAGVAASIVGSVLAARVPGDGHALTFTIAVLMGVTAVRTARPRRVAQPESDGTAHVGTGRPLALGAVGGLASGLLGIGGGLILVPGFTGWLRLPLRVAIGTSLACIGLIAIPGTLAHTALGHTDWWFAGALALGVVPGARLGSGLTMRVGERHLRTIVATGLALLAAVYGVIELRALLR